MDGSELKIVRTKRIKKEPPDPLPLSYFEYEDYGIATYRSDNGDEVNGLGLEIMPPLKHSASPAQEATRAKISTIESQLNRLYRLRSSGKLDHKGVFQIRCLEDDLRKAHSKLRRLLNEAERQRRRRERLRSSVDSGMFRDVHHGYRHDSLAFSQSQDDIAPAVLPDDKSIMAALRSCGKFEDFVRELHSLGFTLSRMTSDPQVFDIPDGSDNGGEEVKVHVELVEGEGVIENNFPMTEDADIEEIKTEPPASPSSEEDPICTTDQDNEPEGKKRRSSPPDNTLKMFADEYARKHVLYVREWQSQYQDWFERQMEAQQQYEETLMREQMELTKSMLESVTATFLQGIQQVLQNVVANVGRRPMTPFCPTAAMNFDFNSHNSPHAGLSTFMESQSSASNSRTFVQNQTANCTADKHCVGNQA